MNILFLIKNKINTFTNAREGTNKGFPLFENSAVICYSIHDCILLHGYHHSLIYFDKDKACFSLTIIMTKWTYVPALHSRNQQSWLEENSVMQYARET